jgi:anti-anti-sigma regulatory factor
MRIFRRETARGITVISLKVRALDTVNTEDVMTGVANAMRGESRTIVDLGALRYFDVSGLAAILKWAAGGADHVDVRLCSRSGDIQALFELLRGDALVPLYRSREEALASFHLRRPMAPAPGNGSPSRLNRPRRARTATFGG